MHRVAGHQSSFFAKLRDVPGEADGALASATQDLAFLDTDGCDERVDVVVPQVLQLAKQRFGALQLCPCASYREVIHDGGTLPLCHESRQRRRLPRPALRCRSRIAARPAASLSLRIRIVPAAMPASTTRSEML